MLIDNLDTQSLNSVNKQYEQWPQLLELQFQITIKILMKLKYSKIKPQTLTANNKLKQKSKHLIQDIPAEPIFTLQ